MASIKTRLGLVLELSDADFIESYRPFVGLSDRYDHRQYHIAGNPVSSGL